MKEFKNRAAYKKRHLKRLSDDRPDLDVKVYLGCGSIATQIENYINIDIQPYEGCIVWDFLKGLSFIPDNSIDKFYARLSFEFIPRKDLLFVLSEIYRKLKPGGHFELLAFDLEAHCRELLVGIFKDNHEYVLRHLYGRQLYDFKGNPVPGTFKTTMFTYQVLAICLSKTGFCKIQKIGYPRFRIKMLVTGYKPLTSDEPMFLTVDGLPKSVLDGTFKLRFHKINGQIYL